MQKGHSHHGEAETVGVIGGQARIANPALQPLQFRVWTSKTRCTHPPVPGTTVHRTACAWHQGGDFFNYELGNS